MNKEICPTCGSKTQARWERLSPLLVKMLIKFHSAVSAKGENSIRVSKELELSKTEYNNFQKLRFHALIAKAKENGEKRAGYWVITRRGGQFLKGELAIPREVKIFRNKIQEHGTHLVTIKDIIDERIYLDTINDFLYEPVELSPIVKKDEVSHNVEWVFKNGVAYMKEEPRQESLI